MHRKFITLIIAAAVAVTGLAAVPAYADDRNSHIFAGLAALTILGIAIHEMRDDDAPTVSRVDPPLHYPARPRPLPSQVSRYDLPGKCMRNLAHHGGPRRILGLQCLQNNYHFTGSLPQACRYSHQSRYSNRTGYEPLCLRERGYRIVRN